MTKLISTVYHQSVRIVRGILNWWGKLFADVGGALASIGRFVRDEPLISVIAVILFASGTAPRFFPKYFEKQKAFAAIVMVLSGIMLALLETVVM